MIPMFRIGGWKVRFGPYRVDLDRGSVETSPWPEWMEEIFPHPLAMVDPPGWKPVGYSATRDGGIWVVETAVGSGAQPEPGAAALFLTREGELRTWTHLPRPEHRAGTEVLVFGEWSVVLGSFLRKSEVVGHVRPDDETVLSFLDRRKACLDPNGALILPDGRRILPDGRESTLFDPEGMARVIERASGGHVRVDLPLGIDPLGFDGDLLWVLAGPAERSEERPERFAIAGVRIRDGGLSVEILRQLEVFQRPLSRHLNDGGWVVRIPGGMESSGGPVSRTERWMFRLPDREEIDEHEPCSGKPHPGLFGMAFCADPGGGLLALLGIGPLPYVHEIQILLLDGSTEKTAGLFSMPFHTFAMLIKSPWIIVGRGESGRVIFGERRQASELPPGSFALDDLERVISAWKGVFDPRITGILRWNDALLAHGFIPLTPRWFLSSFRMSGGKPEPVFLHPSPGSPRQLAAIPGEEDGFGVAFRFRETPSGAVVWMKESGELFLTIVA